MKLKPCNATSLQQIVSATLIHHEVGNGPHTRYDSPADSPLCANKYNNGVGNTDLYTHAIFYLLYAKVRSAHVAVVPCGSEVLSPRLVSVTSGS